MFSIFKSRFLKYFQMQAQIWLQLTACASAPINWKGLHPTALKSMCDFVCDFQKLWFRMLEVRGFRLQVFSEVLSHSECNTYSSLVMWKVSLQEKMLFFLLLFPPSWIRLLLQLALTKDRWSTQSIREAGYVLGTPIYLCKVHSVMHTEWDQCVLGLGNPHAGALCVPIQQVKLFD